MCSVQEEDIENVNHDKISHSKLAKLKGQTCMKCGEQLAAVVVRGNDPLCRTCFLTCFVHKFRATIGKARVIRQGERVLVAFSGGMCSRAMLHMVCDGLSERATRKLRFLPGVVFVDEGAVLGQSQEERVNNISFVRAIVEKTGFPFHVAKLEDVFKDTDESSPANQRVQLTGGVATERHDGHHSCESSDPSSRDTSNSNLLAQDKLQELFKGVTSMTAKEDWLVTLRNEVLCRVAKEKGFSKVMLGNCATRLSIRLLSNISQGRGAALPFDIGFADTRYVSVMFVRPMREFMAKEIALYNHFNHNEMVDIKTLTTMSHPYSSIDRLTERFVTGLQEEYSFTVSTIFRTGEKLSSKENLKNDDQCTLCGVPTDSACSTVSLDHMTKVFENVEVDDKTSSMVSTGPGECHSDCDRACAHKEMEVKLTVKEVTPTLCYGCQLTLRDINPEVDFLPPFLTRSAQNVLQRGKMKGKIQEFLLEDN